MAEAARKMKIGFLLVPCIGSLVFAQQPNEVQACLNKAGALYKVRPNIIPGFLSGDFDGDGKPDYAVVVLNGRKSGVAICRSGAPAKADVLGAGTPFHDFDDLDFTNWRLHPKKLGAHQGAGGDPPPRLRGDALLLDWAETASALVYWNGKRFVWYQQGD